MTKFKLAHNNAFELLILQGQQGELGLKKEPGSRGSFTQHPGKRESLILKLCIAVFCCMLLWLLWVTSQLALSLVWLKMLSQC